MLFAARTLCVLATSPPPKADSVLTAILPVDLNSIMYMNERRLAAFHMLLNDTAQANYYTQQAERRLVAIQKYFWNPERLSWFDYNYLTGRQNVRRRPVIPSPPLSSPILSASRLLLLLRSHTSVQTAWFPSNLMPLWARAYDPRQFPLKQVEAIVLAQRKAFSFPAGVPTSYTNTTQQWDYPNAWPPLQFFLIEALLEQPSAVLQQIATDLMQRWITTNFCAWNATGYMFEKYDALHIGLHGQGGEYDVQNGFGWTNGVVLGYLHRFGSTLRVTEHCPPVPTLVSAPRVQTATVSCLDFPEIRHHLAR
jgi:alpha,alpha-trehalase